MKHTILAALLLTITACGDNVPVPIPDAPAPLTWRDAHESWADAWCQSAERCLADEFAGTYTDQATCRGIVFDLNCGAHGDACDDLYPLDRVDALARCHADMLVLKCSAQDAPPSCYEAFGGR